MADNGSRWIAFAGFLYLLATYGGFTVRCNGPKSKTYSEQDGRFWIENGKDTVAEKVKYVNRLGVAKNVIMFLGDGMSLTTLTAARIYKGQLAKRSGESEYLSFEKFPYIGMAKTYCVNKQVADSACTATAYLSGVKATYQTIGLSAAVALNDCPGSVVPGNRTQSIAEWSMAEGKWVGVVTTTRVTHASPAGVYAHTANRNWESDADLVKAANLTDVTQCEDIAKQLITGHPGRDIKVILGGGRKMFLLNDTNQNGKRMDVDLVRLWKEDKAKRFGNGKASYVENRQQLLDVNPKKTEFLLGLFDPSHMKYRLEADAAVQPTLAEMTEKAVRMLESGPNGYFLFVEGGLIDMGHHNTRARLALDETVELSKAVQVAADVTDERDTLIVVTSDHAHVMTMAGYPERGNDILGLSGLSGADGLSYATLGYANGPPATTAATNANQNAATAGCNATRNDLTNVDMSDPSFTYPRMVPLEEETHGGDDVMVFARGPWAHLFTGNYEQNVVPLSMGFAAGVGPAARLSGAPAPYRAAVSVVRPPPAVAVLVATIAALTLCR